VNALASLRFRRAVPADLDDLVELEQRTFVHDRIARAQYRRHLESDTALVLAARWQRRLIGASLIFFRRNSTVARLYSLAIVEDARGHGIGVKLLAASERAARQRRCSRMRLEVRVDNARAIALYERQGYERVGLRKGFYEDGTDALKLEKPLA
jgi:[ribosomal protein S18]-alanine N-acetyltransferase